MVMRYLVDGQLLSFVAQDLGSAPFGGLIGELRVSVVDSANVKQLANPAR
jgi:hypothetical protein